MKMSILAILILTPSMALAQSATAPSDEELQAGFALCQAHHNLTLRVGGEWPAGYEKCPAILKAWGASTVAKAAEEAQAKATVSGLAARLPN